MLGDLFDELLYGIVPDHPAVRYLLPTVLLGGGPVAVAEPFPALALAVGVVASVALLLAYEYTGLQRESTGGERSTADWVVTGAFLLVVAGVVVVGEVEAIDPGVSATQVLGAVTGLLVGASVEEWLLPPVRTRIECRIQYATPALLLQVRWVVARAVLLVLSGVALVVEQQSTVLTLVPRRPVALRGFDHIRTWGRTR